VGIIGIFRDVTEQKRAEDKIQEAVRRRDEFLAMLSHELRNPLGAVVGAAALLRHDSIGAERKRALIDVLRRQSEQMSRLLDDLLEVSRVTQDKIELRSRVLDLKPVVEEAISAVAGLLEARQIELRVELDAGPLFVEGDPARLQQIQVNLLTNAAKYTQRGGHVLLQVKREGAQIVLRVRDDGMGIPKHMLDEVFDLFVQSTRTLERAEGGLGVGLTLVRGLVTKHGGQISAHSDGEGKGSEFVVRLPAAAGTPEPVGLSLPAGPQAAAGLRVAVVEDGEDSRVMLCELLQLAGFECKTAATGSAGLALIDDFHPDIALIDIGIPEIDGLELARRIRKNPQHAGIHLIALTGYGQREDRDNTRGAGFDDHMVKPVDCDALIRSLAREGLKLRSRGEPVSS
jgi:two-component system CheB/CheR fusion protein